jgi:hypothetical protein
VKTEDFPQHLNLHLFVRKGDILGISLRNLHGKVSFALQGTCDGKEILKPADFRYTKRFDARWLQTADLTGYEVPATATAKGIRLGAKQDVSVAQARQGDIDTRALHYKYVFR